MTVVNYQEKRVAPLLFFLLFVVVCLIGLPIWYLSRFGSNSLSNTPHVGSIIIAPLLALLYLIVIGRTFRFNARVRAEPRALQWDNQSLYLWQGKRFEKFSWPQIRSVSLQGGGRANDLRFLRITALKPGGEVSRWVFPSGRLQLAGQSIATIAAQLQQARTGVAPLPPSPRPERDAAIARYNERASAARGWVAVVSSVYFVTIVGMIVYLESSRTTWLTPRDPLLWNVAKGVFIAVAATWLGWYARTLLKTPASARVVLFSMLPTLLFTALGSALMLSLWAYLAANVYDTAGTFGGHVEHGAVLMSAVPGVPYHGHPTIHARLMDRPGPYVVFAISDADKKSMDEWYQPDVPEDRACVTVPVEWSGPAIRAEISEYSDTLPRGSVTGCS